jgi:ElaA protein
VPVAFHHADVRAIDPLTLYAILRLRVEVFVVEQSCPYPELDGRDVEPDAELHWATDGQEVLATLRVLRDADSALRVGRVATAPAARSGGVASQLMREALRRCAELDPSAPVVLDAQAHLAGWYARFGFEVAGVEFEEDGIPHVPMRRGA